MAEAVRVSGAVRVPASTAIPVGVGGEFASRPSGDPWGCEATQVEEGRGENSSPLSSKHGGAVEAPGPSPLPSLLETGLEAAENKWTLTQFSASHMDSVTLSYVMNKLTYRRRFTCQRVFCCTSM